MKRTMMVALLQSRISSRFTYYVDSVNGDDGNAGTSAAQAFQTLAAVPTLTAGQSVGLARGSVWHETLTTADRLTIAAYGTGDAPIIDGSDALSSDGWTDSTGRGDANTNVYSRAAATNATGITDWINIWEDGSNLTYATSLANCQSTPGSYTVSSHLSATPTLYIHPTASGNPASNGKTYRFSAREYCIGDVFRDDDVTIRGIHTRRQLSESGSIVVGRRATIDECVIGDGNKHNIYIEDGGVIQNSTIENAYYTATASLIIFNEDTPANLGITVRNCTLRNAAYNANINGIFSHQNVGGSFGAAVVEDCTFEKINLNISLGSCTSVTVQRNAATNCKHLVTLGAAVTFTLTDNVFTSTGVSGAAAVNSTFAGASLTVSGDAYTIDGVTTGSIFITHSNTTLVLDVDITQTNAGGTSGCIYIQSGLTGCSLTLNNSRLKTNAGYLIRDLTTTLVYVADDNSFWQAGWSGNFIARYHNTDVGTIAAWRTATGQDANSTVNDWAA